MKASLPSLITIETLDSILLPPSNDREGCKVRGRGSRGWSRFDDDCPDGVNVCGQDILGAREARVARRSLSSTRKVDPERGTHTAPFGWVSCDPTFSALCVAVSLSVAGVGVHCATSAFRAAAASQLLVTNVRPVVNRSAKGAPTFFPPPRFLCSFFFFLSFLSIALPRPFLARFNRRVSL